QRGGHLRLAVEALQGGRVVRAEVRHLERDESVQLLVPGQVDGPHAAAAQFLQDVVAAEVLRQPADVCRRGRRRGGRRQRRRLVDGRPRLCRLEALGHLGGVAREAPGELRRVGRG